MFKYIYIYCNRLMEHENDPDIDEPYVPPAENVLGSTVEQSSSPQSPSGTTECMLFSSSNPTLSFWQPSPLKQ